MNPCSAKDAWSRLDSDSRFDAVKEYAQEMAGDWGVEPPEVQRGICEDEDGNRHLAQYDPDTNTITIDPDLFRDGTGYNWRDPYREAMHELGHEMQHAWDDEGGGEDGGSAVSEEGANDFADAMMDGIDAECDGPEPDSPADDGQDGGSDPGGGGGDGGWTLAPEGGHA